ncbi:hypothetical protein [Maridesulfovibrio zosterae]|uniref:hypothetical protein n=1 Tax=Maridesulfovibrio zosterae TaxID=82171 RepID=UPI00041D11BB|nr:hypothetical protein [Maridesulfovibrio zosterae]
MKNHNHNHLFKDCSLEIILRNNYTNIISHVNSIPEEELINTPQKEIVERILSENCVKKLVLHEDKIRMHQPIKCKLDSENKIYGAATSINLCIVDGSEVSVEIPYSGDRRLWVSYPSIHYMNGGPRFTIKSDCIVKNYAQKNDNNQSEMQERFAHALAMIKQYLKWQENDLRLYEAKVKKIAAKTIHYRLQKLYKENEAILAKEESKKHNQKLSRISNIFPTLHQAEQAEPEHEPAISNKDFFEISKIIRETCRMFERTPGIFNIHSDEELMKIIISTLNSRISEMQNRRLFQKSGQAKFNVNIGGKEVHICKCLIWKCIDGMTYALNNILATPTWNNCKVNFIIFNKNEFLFRKVLNSIANIIRKHTSLFSMYSGVRPNEWNTSMYSLNNKSNNFQIHFMAYNIFKGQKKPRHKLTEQERFFFSQLATKE